MAVRRTIRIGVGLALLALATPANAATIATTTTADELNGDGDCSLREAVQSANTNAAVSGCEKGQAEKRDIVKLSELGNDEYFITILSTDEDENEDGDFDVTGGGPLTLRGTGEEGGFLHSAFGDRVIDVLAGASSVRVERLWISGANVADLEAGRTNGGAVQSVGSKLTLSRVRVTSGQATSGGGIYFESGRKLVIDRVFLNNNEAGGGGGLYATTESVSPAGARITRGQFLFNNAEGGSADGGGLFLGVPATITDSTVADNATLSDGSYSRGAGIFASEPIVVRRSLIAENEAEESEEGVGTRGGGLLTAPATDSRVINSTLYGNTSDDVGGGLTGPAIVTHVTFLANSADGDGDHLHSQGPTDPITIRNSILPGTSFLVDLCEGDSIDSKGYSVATYDDSDCQFLDSDVTNPGPIGFAEPAEPADNGGPTETIAITGASPAFNLIPTRRCRSAQGEDQRGFERPKGPRCDAGAFERGVQP